VAVYHLVDTFRLTRRTVQFKCSYQQNKR